MNDDKREAFLGLNLFPPEVARKEIAYYLPKQNKYGLPRSSSGAGLIEERQPREFHFTQDAATPPRAAAWSAVALVRSDCASRTGQAPFPARTGISGRIESNAGQPRSV
jgi:hypothetical protein